MKFLRNSWDELRLAIGFFTRLPVGQSPIGDDRPFAKMLWAAPIAGLLVAGGGGWHLCSGAYFRTCPLDLCGALADGGHFRDGGFA